MEFLAFRIGREEYGINLLAVQEIRSFESPVRIAGSSKDVLGVINLRGQIVPIIDMRIRFGNSCPDYNDFTIVVIVSIHGKVVGLVVDAVSDVVQVGEGAMRPPPLFDAGACTGMIMSIAALESRMIILLDAAKLVPMVDPGDLSDRIPQEELVSLA